MADRRPIGFVHFIHDRGSFRQKVMACIDLWNTVNVVRK